MPVKGISNRKSILTCRGTPSVICWPLHSNRELTQQDGWNSQEGRTTKKSCARLRMPHFFVILPSCVFQPSCCVSSLVTTSFPGSLFSASLSRWDRGPGCGRSRDHLSIQNRRVGGYSSTFGRDQHPVAPPYQQIFLPPRFWVVTWPAATSVSVPTTKGGREERSWERDCPNYSPGHGARGSQWHCKWGVEEMTTATTTSQINDLIG